MQIGDFLIAPIDIIFTLIILIMIIKSVLRGFVAEFMGIASIVLGIFLGIIFSARLGVFIAERFGITNWSHIIAFLAIFLFTYLFLKLFENGISTIVERIHLDKLDKSLGLFFGILEGMVIVILIVFLIQIQPIFDTTTLEAESMYFKFIQLFLPDGKTILDGAINV